MNSVARVTSFVLVPLIVGVGAGAPTNPKPHPSSIQREHFQGTLPDSANRGGTSFYQFMNTLTWGDSVPVRMCTGWRWTCWVGFGSKTNVTLKPVAGAYTIDPHSVDSAGMVLVSAVNHGESPTLNYGFRPGFIYAVVVYPNHPHDTASHWVLMEINVFDHLAKQVPGQTGPYKPCIDGPPTGTDRVGLYKCGEAHPMRAPTMRSAMGLFDFFGTLFTRAGVGAESPMWKSCPSGCCTLGTT